MTAGAADAHIVDGDTALNRIAAGSGEGDKELRRVVRAVQEAAATGLERMSSSGGGSAGTRYRCCNQVGVTTSLEYDPSNPDIICVKEVGEEILATASGITAAGQVRVMFDAGWVSLKSGGGELMLVPLGRR